MRAILAVWEMRCANLIGTCLSLLQYVCLSIFGDRKHGPPASHRTWYGPPSRESAALHCEAAFEYGVAVQFVYIYGIARGSGHIKPSLITPYFIRPRNLSPNDGRKRRWHIADFTLFFCGGTFLSHTTCHAFLTPFAMK